MDMPLQVKNSKVSIHFPVKLKDRILLIFIPQLEEGFLLKILASTTDPVSCTIVKTKDVKRCG